MKKPLIFSLVILIILGLIILTGAGCVGQGGDSDSIIWGRVMSVGNNLPIANVRFSIDGINIFGVTDDTGMFRFERVPAGMYTTKFIRQGQILSTITFTVTPQQALDGDTIQLTWPTPDTGGGSMSGVVTDDHAAPLGGAEVLIGRPDGNIQKIVVDEFGAYAVTDLPFAGGYTIVASIYGFQPKSVLIALNPDNPDRVNFQLEPLVPPTLPSGIVKGNVVDSEGVQVPGAYVTIYPRNALTPVTDLTGETGTGPIGDFQFLPVPEGPYVIWVGKAGRGVTVKEIFVTADLVNEAEYVLTGGYSIEP